MSLKSKIKLQRAILKMLMEPDKNLKAKAAARVEKLSKQLSA
jgi:hypothetical protein